MNTKIVTILAVSFAVIAAAVAAIVVSMNRADEAKAYAEAMTAQADAGDAQAKTVLAQADAEKAKRQAAEASAQAAKDKLAAEELSRKTAADNAQAEKDKKAAAEAQKLAAEAQAKAALNFREAAKLTNETARAEQQKAQDLVKAEQAKADAAAAKLEATKLETEKTIAEAKALELRKIDFETAERELLEWKRDLEEREAALRPEKTIANLDWAGGMEDTVIDDKGNLVKQVKAEYDPEKDMALPGPTRKLEKVKRQAQETTATRAQKTRESVISSIERLYVAALRDNRVIDAEFYRKAILSMYPDWKFKGEK